MRDYSSFRRIATLILFVLALKFAASAQTLTQQSPTDLQSPVLMQNYSTAGAQGTITITPPAGQFVYIVEIDSQPFNGTNTTVTNGFVTTTGLGANPKWAVGVGATAQAMGTGFTFAPSHPYKSAAAGTAVTVVTPATLANATWDVNVFYYFAL